MPRVPYRKYYLSGERDAHHAFTPHDDVDLDALAELLLEEDIEGFSSAVAEAVRGVVMDEDDFADSYDIEEEDTDVAEAYRQWSAGWVAAAIEETEEAARARAVDLDVSDDE